MSKYKKQLKAELNSSFDSVARDMDFVFSRLDGLGREVDALRSALQGHKGFVDEKFEELETNGVATAINKLNKEVFENRKGSASHIIWAMSGLELGEEATLAGKVNAIIDHLGIDVSVKPSEKAKVVASKVTKKKGKK